MSGLATYQFAEHTLTWTKADGRTTQRARFSELEAAIFGTLVKRLGHVVQKWLLIDEMYPKEADEPDDPEMNLRVQICAIRHMIEGSPVTIENARGSGYIAHGHVEIDWTGL